MTKDDVMVSITITLQRDGTVNLRPEFPNGPIAADGTIGLGMLEVAKSQICLGIKQGRPAPEGV